MSASVITYDIIQSLNVPKSDEDKKKRQPPAISASVSALKRTVKAIKENNHRDSMLVKDLKDRLQNKTLYKLIFYANRKSNKAIKISYLEKFISIMTYLTYHCNIETQICGNPEDKFFLSMRYMANKLGIDYQAVRRIIFYLEKFGLISRQLRNFKNCNGEWQQFKMMRLMPKFFYFLRSTVRTIAGKVLYSEGKSFDQVKKFCKNMVKMPEEKRKRDIHKKIANIYNAPQTEDTRYKHFNDMTGCAKKEEPVKTSKELPVAAQDFFKKFSRKRD